MDPLASAGDAQPTLTQQELRHRQPYGAADEVTLPGDGVNADGSKLKQPHGHHRTTTTDDGHSQGFLPGLMTKLGLGGHHEPHATDGTHELKSTEGEHRLHPHHHRRGTRDKELFGLEDSEVNYREHRDLFGSGDFDNPRNIGKSDSLFGLEDTKFEAGETGRNLVGNDDPNTLSNRDRMNLVGSNDGDEGETRHVFGEENTEDSDDEGVRSAEYKKDVHVRRSD